MVTMYAEFPQVLEKAPLEQEVGHHRAPYKKPSKSKRKKEKKKGGKKRGATTSGAPQDLTAKLLQAISRLREVFMETIL
jgi:hypothetical protein